MATRAETLLKLRDAETTCIERIETLKKRSAKAIDKEEKKLIAIHDAIDIIERQVVR